jgi:serine protease inhibitor
MSFTHNYGKGYSKNNSNNLENSNDKLSQRDFFNAQNRETTGLNNHDINLSRLDIERSFNRDSKENDNEQINYLNNKKKRSKKIGEITGENLDLHEFDRKMPMRSTYTIKKPIHDSNIYSDFNVFNDTKSIESNGVDYYDPASGANEVGYADVMASMKKISSQIEPISNCSSGIESVCIRIFNKIYNSMIGNQYLINGIGLYSTFLSLYLASSSVTEIELQNYFEFSKKEYVYSGMSNILANINEYESVLNIKNFLLIGHNVPYNPDFLKEISEFIIPIQVNIDNPKPEAQRVNQLISNLMKCEMKKSLVSDNIKNLQLMTLNCLVIKPIWNNCFDKIINGVFNGFPERREITYLYGIGKTYAYYEDSVMQMLELGCIQNTISMGILLSKDNNDVVINEEKLKFFSSHLKEAVLDEVKIPIFQKDFKIRLTNVLANEMSSIFTKLICPYLFPENTVMHDCTQNITVIVGNLMNNNDNNTTGGYRTNRKFICNKPFTYYFKIMKTNTIFLLGTYN